MTYIEKNIVETYTNLFEGLSSHTKIELIESLSKSLNASKSKNENAFFKSFGAFASNQKASLIVADIRKTRKFRKKDIVL